MNNPDLKKLKKLAERCTFFDGHDEDGILIDQVLSNYWSGRMDSNHRPSASLCTQLLYP